MTIDYLLLESGDFLLKEDSDNLLLESSAVYTLVASSILAAGINGGTISGLNMTGVDLIVIFSNVYTPGIYTGISDELGNIYTEETEVAEPTAQMTLHTYWKQTPAVDASMDFSLNGIGIYGTIAVYGFAGSRSSPKDDTNGTISSGVAVRTIGAGNTINVTENYDLVVAAIGLNADPSTSRPVVDSNLVTPATLFEEGVVGVRFGLGASYLLGANAGTITPVFTWALDTITSIRAISFLPFVAPATGGGPLLHGGPLTKSALIHGGRLVA